MTTEEILAKVDVEYRHWSDVFTSTVGIYNGSEYLYRVNNEKEVISLFEKEGIDKEEARKLIKEYCQNKK